MQSDSRFDLVFVLGVAHCGSTLLGRLLHRHPRAYCPGELMRLEAALKEQLPCGCGAALVECPYWAQHLPWLASEYGYDHRRFDTRLYARLAGAAGADVAVDLSKTKAWRTTRRWKDPRVGYILLLRDSRGVLASAARAGKQLKRPLEKHKKWMKRLPRFVQRSGERGFVMRYEDLCSNPEAELRRVTSFLGLEFDAAMLRHAEAEQHFVHSSTSGYLRDLNEIRLDERWRRELDAESLARIEAEMKTVPVLRDHYLLNQPV